MKVTKAWNEKQGTWNVIANNESPESSTNIQILNPRLPCI